MTLQPVCARTLVVAAIALVAACGDSTGPGSGVAVSLRLLTPNAGRVVEGHGTSHVACTVAIEASASGPGSATWDGATFLFFAGVDRSAPIDSFEVTQAELIGSALGPSLSPVAPDTSYWEFTAAVPFSIEARFHYLPPRGSRRSAAVELHCGPTFPANSAPPRITAFEVTGSDATLEAGDRIRVRYAFEADATVLRSFLTLSGPFPAERLVAEDFARIGDRRLEFVIPRLAPLGVPVRVDLSVMDGAGRVVDSSLVSTQHVVDVTPPRLVSTSALPAQLATGQTMRIFASTVENHDLKWIIWELDAPIGHRDSVFIGDESESHTEDFEIPVRPEWSGHSIGYRLWVRDAAGHSSDTLSSAPGIFRIYPTLNREATVIGRLFEHDLPGYYFSNVLHDQSRNQLHFLIRFQSAVASFDLDTRSRLPMVSMGGELTDMDATLSGDSLLIASPDARTLKVVDLVTRVLRVPISLATLLDSAGSLTAGIPPRPRAVRVAANGRAFIELDGKTSGGDRIAEVTLATGAQRIRTDARHAGLPSGPYWSRFGASPDRSSVYMLDHTCARVYLAASDLFGDCRPINPGLGEGWTFDATSSRMAVGRLILGTDLSLVRDVENENIVIAPDGESYYRQLGNSIARVRISDGTFLYRVMVPLSPAALILLPDGRTMVAVAALGTMATVDVGDP